MNPSHISEYLSIDKGGEYCYNIFVKGFREGVSIKHKLCINTFVIDGSNKSFS